MGIFKKFFGTSKNEMHNGEEKADTQNNNGGKDGVAPFENFTVVLETHLVDSLYWVGIPADWTPFASDRFRAKTQDGKTQISITNWVIDSGEESVGEEQLKASVLPLYKSFVEEGGYEAYDDLIVNNNYISKSFKVDEETQYFLTMLNKKGDKVYQSSFIIRDIAEYNPQMRATLLNIAATVKFVENC